MLNFIINTAQAVTLPNFNTTQDLGSFISSIYDFSISIVGIIIFFRFIYAGWLYLTSSVVPARVARAKTMMLNCIIGAVLLFSSYLILYVINPDLVKNSFDFNIISPASAPERPASNYTSTNSKAPIFPDGCTDTNNDGVINQVDCADPAYNNDKTCSNCNTSQ